MKKMYFNEEDRKLIIEIRNKYVQSIEKEKLLKIDDYLKVTDLNRNKLNRFYDSFKFKMNQKKRIFLLFK